MAQGTNNRQKHNEVNLFSVLDAKQFVKTSKIITEAFMRRYARIGRKNKNETLHANEIFNASFENRSISNLIITCSYSSSEYLTTGVALN